MPERIPVSREALQAEQLRKLRELIREILPSNRFYAEKLGSSPPELGDFATIRQIPFTEKKDLVADQEQTPPYGTNLTFPIHSYTRAHQTSGTSGRPLRWLDTPESWQWMVESWKTVFKKAGAGHEERFYFAFSFGPFLGFWLAFEAASQLGGLCLPGGGLSSIGRLQSILEQEVTVLCCTPTYALRLAEVAQEESLDLSRSRVRLIVVAGEPGGSIPATRKRLESAWPGARIFDHHGMTEVGPVTYECPENPGRLHVIESAYLAEVLDPSTHNAVEAGKQGELVLTTLGRHGSPLIRYRTGDLVKAHPGPCSCGVPDLALDGGILGRCDEMVVVRGVNIYPGAIEEIVRRVPGVVEYQVRVARVHELAEMEIDVELEGGSNPASTLAKLSKEFELALALRVPVREVPGGSLPRFEMKARRFQVV